MAIGVRHPVRNGAARAADHGQLEDGGDVVVDLRLDRRAGHDGDRLGRRGDALVVHVAAQVQGHRVRAGILVGEEGASVRGREDGGDARWAVQRDRDALAGSGIPVQDHHAHVPRVGVERADRRGDERLVRHRQRAAHVHPAHGDRRTKVGGVGARASGAVAGERGRTDPLRVGLDRVGDLIHREVVVEFPIGI